MLDPRRLKIAQQLSQMFRGNRPHGFQFQEKNPFNNEICREVAEQCPILIEDLDCHLLLYVEALLAQSVRQCVLVYLLDVARAVIAVDGIRGLSHNIAELKRA